VIEVLSPSTERYDRVQKRRLYRQAGVREYWLVSPEDRTVTVDLFGEEEAETVYGAEDRIALKVLPGCEIDLGPVFAPPLAVYPGIA